MRMRLCCRFGSVLCAAAVVLWLIAGLWISSAAAADGTLNLICMAEDMPLTGMQWNLYRVGERNSNHQLVLQDDFASYPVWLDAEDMAASDWQDAADTLENYAVLDGISPMQSGIVGEDGTVSFSGLDTGLYLLCGQRLMVDEKIYVPSALLVEMTASEEGGTTVSSLTIHAKYQMLRRPTVSEQIYRVQKVWQNDEDLPQLRPVTIDVGLYCNGVLVQTVTLSRDNQWTYSWRGDALSEWRVKEMNILGDYTVVYRDNETQFVVVNSRRTIRESSVTSSTTTTTTTETTTTSAETTHTTLTTSQTTGTTTTSSGTTTSASLTATSKQTTTGTTTVTTVTTQRTSASGGGSLPQTGQLWWPVPVCGAGGLILFAVGWRLHRKK